MATIRKHYKNIIIGAVASGNADISKFRQWRERMQVKCAVAKAEYLYAWISMKKRKKIVWIGLMALTGVMLMQGIAKGCASDADSPIDPIEMISV